MNYIVHEHVKTNGMGEKYSEYSIQVNDISAKELKCLKNLLNKALAEQCRHEAARHLASSVG